jgi:hypothetical protein
MFQCTPAPPTQGSGALHLSFLPSTPVTCTALTAVHRINGSATITWKNSKTTTIAALAISTTGSTRLLNLAGAVRAGLFAGHSLSGQLRWAPVVSPHGHSLAEACANRVAPGGLRISLVGLTLSTTRPIRIA